MSKSFPRARRVGEQIQRTLSELIRRELRDPRLGPVTLIDVQVTPDLSTAKVFYSILGGDKQPQLTQEILTAAAPLLRGPLGRALRLRHAPELRFLADEVLEHGAHLSTLIRTAVEQDAATHVAESNVDGDTEIAPQK